jgi:murein DD-endopeptidase MepM/ murein hydrolase activator NlpD
VANALATCLLVAAGCSDSVPSEALSDTNGSTRISTTNVSTTSETPARSAASIVPAATRTTASEPATTQRRDATTSENPATTSSPPPSQAPSDGIGTTAYLLPVADANRAGWGDTHSSYPATDIFVSGGCGGAIVSPVDGVALEVRTIDGWDASVDDPATRGGRSVAILGDDGVRYYLAHFEDVKPDLFVGTRVEAGTVLGTIGETGRSSACHVHFGISPPCPDPEWRVRRGVVWPWPYLDAWAAGEAVSPAVEVAGWLREHPDACAAATAGE